jgi:hypothetical protein
MAASILKNKINKQLEQMNEQELKSAWRLLQEFSNQQKFSLIKINKKEVDKKIAKGIQQLDNGEGTDFRAFLNEMQTEYGRKK